MRRLNVILFFLGVAFFAYLVGAIGVKELSQELRLLGWGLIPFIVCEGVAELIHTRGWRHCLDEPYRSLPWFSLFRIRMAGYAINYLTPTAALGGEVTRAALLASNHRGPGAVSGVLIEKVCFGLAHVLVVVFGTFFVVRHVQLPRPLWLGMLLSGAIVATGVVAFLLLQRFGKLGALIRWAAAQRVFGSSMQKAASQFTEVDEAMKVFYRERSSSIWHAVGWHLVGHAVGLVQTWFFFHWLKVNMLWETVVTIWFLGMWFDLLTFAVPMNAGTLEGSRILALKTLGFSPLLGMTYGVALRLAQLFWTSIGLLVYGLLVSRETRMAENRNPACCSNPNPSG